MRFIQKRPSHKPQLVIRVGITGDSLKKLPEDLSIRTLIDRIESALRIVHQNAADLGCSCQGLYKNCSPELRLIFAPLGGLEYLAAGVALEQQYNLQVLLPFDRERYEEEFLRTPLYDPLASAFREVIKKATEIIELDGSPDNMPTALEAAGQALLRQCDLLISVWSGEEEELGQLVRDAISRGLPTIWIHPLSKKVTVLCERGLKPGDPLKTTGLEHLSERLKTIFVLSQQADPGGKALVHFLAEKHPNGLSLFRKFRDFIARGWDKNLAKEPAVKDDLSNQRDPWSSLACPNGTVGSKIIDRFREHFERADSMANAYGDIYRSLFLITYGLGALAVLSAFCGIYLKEHAAFWIELSLISIIAIVVATANFFHVHERWIDYRLLGEGIRQMEFLAPLARATPAFEVPAHLDHDDPGRTWFNWYFRAIIREAGLISAKIDKSFLERYRLVLASAVNKQVEYHSNTGRKMELIHHRLHLFVAWVLFPATLIACILHLTSEWIFGDWLSYRQLETVDFFLSLSAIVFPAMGAAIEGIVHQGEFDRIDRRSQALRARLKALHTRLTVTEKPNSSRDLGIFAEYFCQIQILEQADWRAAFVSKPLSPP